MFFRTTLLTMTSLLLSFSISAEEVTYRITFEGFWATNPLPGGAHFSPLIGATHSNPGEIFSVGSVASPGVEDVAEIGQNAALITEINNGIAGGDIGSLILRPGNVGPAATVNLEFNATSEHHLMTFLTMIAPSPDWFVAVHDLNLQDSNGNWLDSIVVDLNSYDAGTENGTSFSLSNAATVPQGVITALDDAVPGSPLFGMGSIATLSIERVSSNPSSLAMEQGETLGGTIVDAICSDDSYLSLLPSLKPPKSGFPISTVFDSAVPVGTSSFELEIESGSNTASVFQIFEYLNHETGNFEFVGTNTISNQDSNHSVTVFGDMSRFVDNKTGAVSVRISWVPDGLLLVYPWVVRIDNLTLEHGQ